MYLFLAFNIVQAPAFGISTISRSFISTDLMLVLLSKLIKKY